MIWYVHNISMNDHYKFWSIHIHTQNIIKYYIWWTFSGIRKKIAHRERERERWFKWDPIRKPIWSSSKIVGSDCWNNVCTQIPSICTHPRTVFSHHLCWHHHHDHANYFGFYTLFACSAKYLSFDGKDTCPKILSPLFLLLGCMGHKCTVFENHPFSKRNNLM